jgi:hypothetical protein
MLVPMSGKQDTSVLYGVAYRFAEEIHAGRWNHIAALAAKPAPACDEIIAELQRRSPGFTRPDYQQALTRALHDSR